MRRRAASAGSWLASHPVEAVFALFLIVALTYQLRITREEYYFWDEWNLVEQARSLGGWFEPFHQALGLVNIAHYRVLTDLFGFDYTPVRVVALIGFLSVSAAYFLTTRRQFGAPLAALLALPLLWVSRQSIHPNELNHQLALLGAIVCAAALNRGRRADWLLAAALTFALLSAGGGLAAAAACLVHNACTRAHLRRWLAVLAPTLLWGVWYLSFLRRVDAPDAMSNAQALRFIRGLGFTPFDSVALGVTAIGVVLAVAFVAYAIWALARGLEHGANVLAWSIGLVVWSVGLVNSRGTLASTSIFSYRYVALGMVLLALVPRRPIVWPARFPITTDRRWSLAAAGAILLLGAARGLAVRGDLQASASSWGRLGRVTRAEALIFGLRPTVAPASRLLPFELGWRPPRHMRSLFDHYGSPFPTDHASADQRLVDLGVVTARRDGRRDTACTPLTKPVAFAPPARGQVKFAMPSESSKYLWSSRTSFAVDVRRFGDDWVRLKEVAPGEALNLTFLPDAWAEPWEVRADGACWSGPPEVEAGTGSVVEGNSGTTVLHVPVTLSNSSSQTVTAPWATVFPPRARAGQADPTTDYTPARGTVTFAPGETEKTITIAVNGDTIVEQDEHIFVRFTNPTNATRVGFHGLGDGVITNDD